MNKLNNRWLLILVLLFAVNGEAKNPASNEESPKNHVTDVKIDTLCLYGMMRWHRDVKPAIHFKNEAQLTALLNVTGYFESEFEYAIAKKMTHQPDFKKWTYFAFIDPEFKHSVDISYGKDTTTITRTKLIQPWICEPEPCLSVSRLPDRILVYFIPFTDKPIKFVELLKQE